MDDFTKDAMRLTGYMVTGGVLFVLLGLLFVAVTHLDNQVAGSIIGGSTALFGSAIGGLVFTLKEQLR
jgi:hypothetical protein